jgi:hypothetical protein
MWDSAIRKNIIQKISQQKYSFTTSTGDQVEFSRKSFNELLKEESFITELKLALAEAYIITTKTVSSEDISYADAGEDG